MWPNSQFPADLVTSTEEIRIEKLHFLSSDKGSVIVWIQFLVSWRLYELNRIS